VIGVGAFTRLSDAGLGCPDWPACYGQWFVKKPSVASHINIQKAQTEMGHRYLAGVLGVLIMMVAILCAMIASSAGFRFLIFSLGLFLLLMYQVLLGMLTVTLKLSPIIVAQHLLVGMFLLSLLWLIYLNARKINATKIQLAPFTQSKKLNTFAIICFLLLILQIVMGAWVSGHDAGLIYHGVSAVHRWGALVIGVAFLALFLGIKKVYPSHYALKNTAHLLLVFLLFQVILGAVNVIFVLPLFVAIAHNLVAATLLLIMTTINYYLVEIR
jgi:cytochrome c oxidase assembly protein subunit 15